MQIERQAHTRSAVRWSARSLIMPALAGIAMAAGTAAAAKTVVMTASTVNTALAAVKAGDKLVLKGNFSSGLRIANRDFGGVYVDATDATLTEGMFLTNVHNIAFTGGTWGRSDRNTKRYSTIDIQGSSNVSLFGATVIGNGDARGNGIGVGGSSFITLRNNDLVGHWNGVGVGGSRDSLIVGNNFRGMTSDGIQLISNQRMLISENRCTGGQMIAGSHPDCLQMWSKGSVLQSDIFVLNNYAEGATQAFSSFDPKNGSGTRLTFAGNYAAVSYSHGVSCYGCTDSVFIDNMFVTPFGAKDKVTLRSPSGTNNLSEGNQWIDLRTDPTAVLPVHVLSSFMPDLVGLVGSSLESRSPTMNLGRLAKFGNLPAGGLGGGFSAGLAGASFGASGGAGAVPEPGTWFMLLVGFVLVGRQLRRADREPRLRRVLA